MKAVQFVESIPRYALGKAVGAVYRPFLWSGLSCLRYGEVREPRLPGGQWVRIRIALGGICGSDLAVALLHASPATEPFSSFPFVVGHENVGRIIEVGSDVAGFAPGDRVIADPVLHCAVRGLAEPCPACRRGDTNLCERFTEGDLAPGLLVGACRDTGGSWGEQMVAHQVQLHRVPDHLSDEAALLAEPLSVALHATMRNWPDDDSSVLVVGVGVVGCLVVAALRALGSRARIVVIARHRFQAELAESFGADEVILGSRGSDHYGRVAKAFGARVLRPILGKPVLVGGADQAFDCVGSAASVDDGLRFVRSGGRLVVIGLTGVLKETDWTPLWQDEVEVRGSSMYSTELFRGQRMTTFAVALALLSEGRLDLAHLVTHRFPLRDYRRALETVTDKRHNEVVKAVLVP